MSNLGGGCFSPGREIIEANNDKAFQPRLKKQRSRNIFKVALSKMRGRSEKPKAVQVDDDGSRSSTWRKLVGSMRTLQMQDADYYSSAASSPSNPNMVKSPSVDRFESFPNSPLSNFASSSRYSSAIGLNKLVENDESLTEYEHQEKEDITKKHDDHGDGDGDGDDMIDAKAEEFIAEFYLQMKLQKFNKMDPHYRKISQRSLGL